MFGLFSGLWEYAFAKKEVFILIAGVGSVGKTTFLEQLKAIYKGQRDFTPPTPSPTVGLNIAKVEAGPIKLTFWDLGGQRSLRPIWEKYMGTADACVFVVDSACSSGELEEARSVLEWMMNSGSISRVPYLIVANKQDLSGARTPAELARDLRLESINLPAHAVQSMCALQGSGVEEGMSWLVDQVLAQIDPKDESLTISFFSLDGCAVGGEVGSLRELKAIYKGQRDFTPPTPSPTVGLNIAKVEAGPIKLTFWDLGGQRSLRPIWEKYMGTADACVFVVDSACSVGELEEARSVLEWMMSSGSISRVPYLIVANKQDLPGARTPSELARDLRLESINLPAHAVQSMCALQGSGVEEGMSWLVDQVLAQIDAK
eukprot:CAMPEP_0201541382 /NCGR_PEP_ID=MMETSP0161_2-20130828/71448_1 /ASSEMBLY_ACC=CAM_ASM_000251 /TAXON_ID=180227 /ORGANISM="Neoparamoeba aestuarina, Strain SoJaBio B1-5/56/2" /LENGTH=373 /DNA_ID=CAMNT_0047948917 /DNA_START=449 /DNA_END=1572 /DNA_ORIENTATION=-